MDASGNVSAPSPTFQLQVGGGSTAGTPQYASGALSGQATAGSLVTIVDGNVVLGVVIGRLVRQLAVHAHAVEGQTQHHGGGHQQRGLHEPACRAHSTVNVVKVGGSSMIDHQHQHRSWNDRGGP